MRNAALQTRHQINEYLSRAAPPLLGVVALALLTWMCFAFQLNLATICFVYLIAIVLLSLVDDFICRLFFPSPLSSVWPISLLQQFSISEFRTQLLSHQNDRHQVVITVQDCGIGISDENVGRLFNAFFTTKSKGMGMGLSICRSIIEAHDGRISAFGNDGPGATLQFVLPAYRQIAS